MLRKFWRGTALNKNLVALGVCPPWRARHQFFRKVVDAFDIAIQGARLRDRGHDRKPADLLSGEDA